MVVELLEGMTQKATDSMKIIAKVTERIGFFNLRSSKIKGQMAYRSVFRNKSWLEKASVPDLTQANRSKSMKTLKFS